MGLTIEDLFDDVNRLKKRVSELKADLLKLWQELENCKKVPIMTDEKPKYYKVKFCNTYANSAWWWELYIFTIGQTHVSPGQIEFYETWKCIERTNFMSDMMHIIEKLEAEGYKPSPI